MVQPSPWSLLSLLSPFHLPSPSCAAAAFAALPAVDQTVIADICRRMGDGMAAFAGRDLREGTVDVADYNLYCYYVAGLVGEGLSRLWVAHGDEDALVALDTRLSYDMGLFLQKTNIIRDYLEDLVEGRAFWPREVWGQYSAGLSNLRHKVDAARAASAAPLRAMGAGSHTEPSEGDDLRFQEDQARACLNHLVADALTVRVVVGWWAWCGCGTEIQHPTMSRGLPSRVPSPSSPPPPLGICSWRRRACATWRACATRTSSASAPSRR
jgi:hypothetical protein